MEEQLGIIRKTVEIRAEKIIKLLYDSMFFSKECVKFSSVRKKKKKDDTCTKLEYGEAQ